MKVSPLISYNHIIDSLSILTSIDLNIDLEEESEVLDVLKNNPKVFIDNDDSDNNYDINNITFQYLREHVIK